MVSVVPVESGFIYVALSGAGRSVVEAHLVQQLAFGRTVQDQRAFAQLTKTEKRDLDRLKRNGDNDARIQLKHDAHFRGLMNFTGTVYVVVNELLFLNKQIFDPVTVHVRERIAGGNHDPLIFPGDRNCAEPKVLQAVFKAGERPTGMTTFCNGNEPSEFVYEGDMPDLRLARPCPYCTLNEQRLMVQLMRR